MYVYCITNTITKKTYVGQTKRTLEKRLKSHLYEASVCKYNMYLHNSIRKHGPDAFTIELLEECDIMNVYDKEKYWINKLNTIQPNGYNEHAGGKGGCLNPSPELREKLRKAKLGNIPWNKGLTKSDPRVLKNAIGISEASKGKPKSESHKKSMIESRKKKRGVYLTEDTPKPQNDFLCS